MQNNEDCAGPVKAFTRKNVDIKAYNCLICGQKGGKEGLRKPQEKGIATFIKSLNLQNECNGCNVSYFLPFVDWISETDSVCWHPKCYSTFCNPKYLSFVTSQESGPLHDNQEPGPSSSQSRATRASNPQFRIREVSIICGF